MSILGMAVQNGEIRMEKFQKTLSADSKIDVAYQNKNRLFSYL